MIDTTAPAGVRIDYAATLDHRTKMLVLTGVLLSLFLSSLDQTIVSTALPSIVADLHGLELLAWVSTSYLLASTAMVPIFGKLSDIYGRKIILLFGITVFLIGSALCGLSPSMLWLVIFRGVQGFGAAALTSAAFAIPADLFLPADRARYQGLFGAAFGLASVLGPFVGGLLTDNISWHWVFYVNLPVGIVALAFIAAKMPRMHSGVHSPIDYFGAATLLLGVIPILLALSVDKTIYAWTSPLVMGLLVLGIIGVALFLYAEVRAKAPILPLHLFRNRTYTLVILIGVVVGATLFASIFFLSLYMVNVLGVSATEAGTTLIPLTLSLVAGSILSSQLVQRIGRYKPIVIVGLVLIVGSLIWLTTLAPDTSVWMVRFRMIALGFGLGPALSLLNLAMQNAVPREYVGAATASRQFFQQLGQMVGSAVFGAVLTVTLTSSLAAHLEPIRAQLPPELAARLDPQTLRNGIATDEDGAPAAGSPLGNIEQSVKAPFDARRTLLTNALRNGDSAAVAQLQQDSQTPAELRALLEDLAQAPQPAREQALTGALASLDQDEQKALQQQQGIVNQISSALKEAFTESIVQIYRYSIALAVLALILSFFIPDVSLEGSTELSQAVALE